MHTHRRTRVGLLLGAAVALVATSLGCRPTPEFYVPPPDLPAQPGDVIRSLPVLYDRKVEVTGTALMYRSTGALGEPNAVTGTLYVPKAPWPSGGSRPVVAFGPGTQGMGDKCAPSLSLPIGNNYEQLTVKGILDQGWAVAVADYEGMGPPGDPTYVVKDAEAHALLDLVRAAQRLPGSGVDGASPVALWGYSQGGQAAAAAAELEASYAPELDVVGAVAGGVPADLRQMVDHLDGPGNHYFAFLAFAALGLNAAYPELQLDAYLNDNGRALLDVARNSPNLCLFNGLTLLADRHIAEFTTSNPLDTQAWSDRVEEQRLGTVAPAVPVFLYHGSVDQIIPVEQGRGLRDSWTAAGAAVQFTEYPVDHLGGIYVGLADGVAFLNNLSGFDPVVNKTR